MASKRFVRYSPVDLRLVTACSMLVNCFTYLSLRDAIWSLSQSVKLIGRYFLLIVVSRVDNCPLEVLSVSVKNEVNFSMDSVRNR